MQTAFGTLRQLLVAVLTTVLCVFAIVGPAVAQQRQHVPGTSVSLVPIDRFTLSSELAGFVSDDGGAIMIMEMPPEAYDQIVPALKNPGKDLVPLLASQGITLDKIEEFTSSTGGKVPLLSGSQGPLDKWMGLFKGEKTVWVIVQSPRVSNREAAVKKMMASVTLDRPATKAEQLAALPFVATSARPFRFTHAYSGLSVGLTIGGQEYRSG